MKILIFDDNSNSAKSAAVLKQHISSEVDHINNPEDALKGILGKNYDLLILDVLMPRMGGIEICEYLAQYEDFKKIPVILTSELPLYSDKFSQSLSRCEELSMVKGVLEKPFSPYDLVAKIISLKI